MDKEKVRASPQQQEGGESAPLPSASKKMWQEPKLAFVEPKLTKHGDLKQLTAGFPGFFGAFSP